VVIDSFSTDETQKVPSRYSNVRFLQRQFDTHAQQWNFGLKNANIATEWVLALDADFIVTEELIKEIGTLLPGDDVAGFEVSFKYCVEGILLRGSVYPPVTVLFRRSCGEYWQDGHTQRLLLRGRILTLANPMLHDDRKPLHRWLHSQGRYMQLEAAKLVGSRFLDLSVRDQLRRFIVLAPLAMFFYCMIVKRNVLDGRAGLFYALQRLVAELLLSICLLEESISRRLGRK
jgi:Glycosyl transferase family 2